MTAGPRLPSLLKEVRACTICAAHLPHGPRPVLQADVRARILIAGQAPGRKAHASGVPFERIQSGVPGGERMFDELFPSWVPRPLHVTERV